MGKIPLAEHRSSIRDIPGGLQIIIPTTPKVLMVLFLAVWLVGWAWGEITVVRQLTSGSFKPDGSKEFMIIWLAGWTLGGIWALFSILWNLAGREVVSVKMPSLVVRRELWGLGRSQEFDLGQVKDLRASQEALNPSQFSSGLRVFGLGGGTIAFDYGAKTYRFGSSLDESEAKHLVIAIKQRFGSL